MSRENALAVDEPDTVGSRPITAIAFVITSGKSLKLAMVSLKSLIVVCLEDGLSGSGMTRTMRRSLRPRRKVILVANRVYKLSFLGKGISVSASRTELLLAD